jgi:hypothetical protein
VTTDPSQPAGSEVLLDEYFAAADDRFLGELLRIHGPNKLMGLAERWKRDPRPWARRMQLEYLRLPLAAPGHNVLVKRLFKHAEARADTELVAAFVHAFDRLVRRKKRTDREWDAQSRTITEREVLAVRRDNLVPAREGRPRRVPRDARLFSYRTRYYLRRRASRYVRRLGYRSPAEYVDAATRVLARYGDEDLASGENILDSWCLLEICHRHAKVLVFTPRHVRLAEGASLGQLAPAPRHPKAWAEPSAADPLWSLLDAGSRFVRIWALAMLEQHHGAFLASLDLARLLPLLDHPDDELQHFAARALEKIRGLESLPVEAWLGLFETRSPAALVAICELATRHVRPERFTLAQAVGLARARATPVARLGLAVLRTKPITTADERALLAELSQAECLALGHELATWALSILGTPEHYDVGLVVRFFDSLGAPIRAAAWEWLQPAAPGYRDPVLWSRLVESPHEDVRLRLVKVLEQRLSMPGTGTLELVPLWSSVLLGIHRGGRHKLIALHQISRALLEQPQHVEVLLPVAAVAVRSVRPAEARVGLAAVVRALEREPALAPKVAAAFPELRLVSQGATS